MKILTITILVILYGNILHASDNVQQNSNNEQAVIKKLYLGIDIGAGFSYNTLPDQYNSWKSYLRFAYLAGLSFHYYFINNIGLHFNVGINSLNGKWNINENSVNIEQINKYVGLFFNLGPSIKLRHFFINPELILIFKLYNYTKITVNVSSSTGIVEGHLEGIRKVLFGIGISFGYRFPVNKFFIPVGIDFRYFLTNLSPLYTNSKAWIFLLKTGFEI